MMKISIVVQHDDVRIMHVWKFQGTAQSCSDSEFCCLHNRAGASLGCQSKTLPGREVPIATPSSPFDH